MREEGSFLRLDFREVGCESAATAASPTAVGREISDGSGELGREEAERNSTSAEEESRRGKIGGQARVERNSKSSSSVGAGRPSEIACAMSSEHGHEAESGFAG